MQHLRDYLRATTIGLFGLLNIGFGCHIPYLPLVAGGTLAFCFAVFLAAQIHRQAQLEASQPSAMSGKLARAGQSDDLREPLYDAILLRKRLLARFFDGDLRRSALSPEHAEVGI